MSNGESCLQCLDRLGETPLYNLWELDTLFMEPLPLDHGDASWVSSYFNYIDLEVTLLFLDSIFSPLFNKQTNKQTNPHPCMQGICIYSKLYLRVWEMEDA